MATSMTVADGTETSLPNVDQEIILDYDPKYGVRVTPEIVQNENRDKTICFKGKNGTKVRVIFLSPFGDELPEMADSEARMLTVGGFYHFKCFFTPIGGKETEAVTGGILDVQPHRP